MPLILSGNVASATAGGYEVANSCRFDGSSAYMHKTPGSEGDKQKWTFSTWVKRSLLGVTTAVDQHLISADAGNCETYVFFLANSGSGATSTNTDCLNVYSTDSDGNIEMALRTTPLYRDPSAWMHVCVAIDTTQGTDTNRAKIYVNGTQVTSFSLATYPAQNENLAICDDVIHEVARRPSGTTKYFNGYLAETVLIDGSQLAPTSFGEFDEDSPTIWKPIDVSGLTFGTNGFYCDYEASDNLGNDANGGTDLTEVNLDATDQATDTPTNNFCTMNPLVPSSDLTFSEGNCKMVSGGSGATGAGVGTFGLTAGKWYWEIKLGSLIANHNHGVVSELTTELYQNVSALSQDTGATTWRNDDGGEVVIDGTVTTADYGIMAEDSIMGIALDMDNHNISYYDDDSALVTDLNISTTRGVIFPIMASGINCTSEVNFGGCSAFTISSAANDENGYGVFEHAPPSGYLSLCSSNLGSTGG